MAFVSVSHLSKSYGSIKAVDDFSFEVSQGEIYALVGPDGAGKTTIIRSMCNLIDPDEGEVHIDGLDVFKQFEQVKSRLGYMPQIFSLYPDLSVEENLTFYAGIYGITGKHYREKSEHLYSFSNLKPFASRRAGALSGGMKQKLALSCALIHEPKLLLLDEPTTGVDPLSRRQFWEILGSLKKEGVTIITSTPYMDEVAKADRACFIFGGRKLAEGTPEELTSLFEGKVYSLEMEPTHEILQRINETKVVRSRRFGSSMHLYTDPDVEFAELAQVLKQVGLEPDKVTPVPPNLEDCFIQLMERSNG